MENDKISTKQSTFMFNVDLLVYGESNALAMERLLHLLNQSNFADYRIKSGIELGRLIEELEVKQPVIEKKTFQAKRQHLTSKRKRRQPILQPSLHSSPNESKPVPGITDSFG